MIRFPMFHLKSFAKINLGLEITGKRPDGYHDLKTVFQTVDLHDTIEIKKNETGRTRLNGDHDAITWDGSNTVMKAVELLNREIGFDRGFDIYVRKRIPPGSGLGGGSSNAAVVMLFLVDYFQLDISYERLIRLAAEVGADVPFFLLGGTAVAEGIGERLTPLDGLLPETKLVDIVIPPVTVPTGLIFSNYGLTTKPITSKIETFIKSKTLNVLENNLEKVTFELFPTVGKIKDTMSTMGYELVLMSGSGSAVFGIRNGSETADGLLQPNSDRIGSSGLTGRFPGAAVFSCGIVDRKNYLRGIGASPSGKAPVFGAGTRRFESSRPS